MRKFLESAGTERSVECREGRGRERAGPKKARRGVLSTREGGSR